MGKDGKLNETIERSVLWSRVVEGIIGWLIEKLFLHGYFPFKLMVNIARQ